VQYKCLSYSSQRLSSKTSRKLANPGTPRKKVVKKEAGNIEDITGKTAKQLYFNYLNFTT